MTKQFVSIQLPFSGFYDSMWSEAIDHEERSHIEYEVDYRQEENGVPEHLRLDADELFEIYMRHTQYCGAYEAIAKLYVQNFGLAVKDDLDGLDLAFEWDGMASPREYNFTTDRIFGKTRLGLAYLLFRRSRNNGHKRLEAMIRERHTSYDGFYSHYTNHLSEWLEKPLREWDHNELCTLLLACLPDYERGEGYDWRLYESLSDGDGFYHEWSEAVDWAKVDADIEELRTEKAEAFKAEHPDVEPPYRCPSTPDLLG